MGSRYKSKAEAVQDLATSITSWMKFSYEYNFLDEDIKPFDGVINLNDDKKLVVDGMSLMYVIGTVLDYEQKLGSSTLVFKNPNEVSSCGCGKSFSV